LLIVARQTARLAGEEEEAGAAAAELLLEKQIVFSTCLDLHHTPLDSGERSYILKT